MKNKIITTILFYLFLFPSVVFAGGQIEVDEGNQVGLGTIRIPTFLSLDRISNFSLFSYVFLGVNLITLFLVGLWVSLIVRAGFGIITSSGDSSAYEGARKKIIAAFSSVAYLVGFYVVISLAGAFFGLGALWDWPQSLSICQNEPVQGRFYFTVKLENPELADAWCL